jgi:hypothetical protein
MTFTGEHGQLRILFRLFLSRLLDFELVSPGGDMQTLAIQFAAILSSVSFVFCFLFVPRYGFSTLPKATLLVNAWGDEEFLISTTMAVIGLFVVIVWDTLLPDLRDTLALGPLPLRIRTLALAKVSAIGAALGLIVLLVNVFTGLCYPIIVIPEGAGIVGLLRSFCAYWITMLAAALFTACALFSVQGLAAQLLPYRLYLRLSSLIQLVSFFLILASYFLKPPLATPAALTAPQSSRWLAFLPSYWFLGLFQELNGPMHPIFGELAVRASNGLLFLTCLAGVLFLLAYRRTFRQIVEQSEIVPGDRSRTPFARGSMIRFLFRRAIDRAIFLFMLRTLFRSRRHRLVVALSLGVGAAIAFAYTESLLHGGWKQTWNRPNVPLMVATSVLLFFSVLGVRTSFSFPVAIPAQWMFRITAIQNPRMYFLAVRKSLYLLAAFPAWSASALLLFAIWPWRFVLQHMLVLILVGIILVEYSLRGFRKIPFACSYLPGKAKIHVTLGIYGTLILFIAHSGSIHEFWATQRPIHYVVFVSILAIGAIKTRLTFNELAAHAVPIQFDDLPPEHIEGLNLQPDSESLSGEIYVNPMNSQVAGAE